MELSKTDTIRNMLNDILIDKICKKYKNMLRKECKITAAVSYNIYKYYSAFCGFTALF